jgi:hypothetical protein
MEGKAYEPTTGTHYEPTGEVNVRFAFGVHPTRCTRCTEFFATSAYLHAWRTRAYEAYHKVRERLDLLVSAPLVLAVLVSPAHISMRGGTRAYEPYHKVCRYADDVFVYCFPPLVCTLDLASSILSLLVCMRVRCM